MKISIFQGLSLGIIANITKLLGWRVAAAGFSFFLTGYITRSFGASDSGVYFLLIATFGFLAALCTLGQPVWLVRQLPRLDGNLYRIKKTFLKSVLMCSVATSLVYGLTVSLFYFFSFGLIEQFTAHLGLGLLPFITMLLLVGYHQGLSNVSLFMISQNLGYQVILFLLLVSFNVVVLDSLLDSLVLSFWIVTIVFLAFVVFPIPRRSHDLQNDSTPQFCSMLKESLPFWLANLSGQASNFLLLFYLSKQATEADISYYAVALRISVTVSFLTMAVQRILAPKLSELSFQNDVKQLVNVVVKYSIIAGLINLSIFFLLYAYIDNVLGFFGEDFVFARNILIITLLGQLVVSITGLCVTALQMNDYGKIVGQISLAGAVLNGVVGYQVIGHYGAMGAAYLYALNLCLLSSVSVYLFYRKVVKRPTQ